MKGAPHFVLKQTAKGPVWYVYAWRGGPQILRSEGAKKPKLKANDWARIAEAGKLDRKPDARLVGGALTAFRQSKYWKDLADSTRKTWGGALDRIEAKWGKVPVRALDDPRMKSKISTWQESMSGTPRAADICVMVLSKFFDWAVLKGHMIQNPALGIPNIYRGESRASIVWLSEDLEAIKKVAQQPLKDAIDLAVLTGLRRADLVALRWDEVGDLSIKRTASKRSRGKRYTVSVPRLPELDTLLEALRGRFRKPSVETVLVNSFGKSWSGDGLASSFHDARKRANDGAGIWHVERDPLTGEEKCTQKRLHDLRGTYATHIMAHSQAALTNNEVASLMGWSPEQVDQIRKRYVDDSAIVVDLTRRLAGGL